MILKNLILYNYSSQLYKLGTDIKPNILDNISIEFENGIIKKIFHSGNEEGIDLKGKWVIPGFVDSHSHPIFCGDRSDEIDLRKQIGYEGILKMGGGIYRTVEATKKCSEDSLYYESKERLLKMMENGTVAMEVKTGYGLDYKNEEKILRVAERLKKDGFDLKITLLAHVPERGMDEITYLQEFKSMMKDFYNRYDYVDVFCDSGAFGVNFLLEVLKYARELGVPARLHLNELANLGALKLLDDYNIKTFDHMLESTEEEIRNVNRIINILPITYLFLNKRSELYSLLKKNHKLIALGSDLSPNSYIYSMPFVIALSRQITPFTLNELLAAGTINSAFSIDKDNEYGNIEVGKKASFIILNENPNKIGYEFYKDPILDVIHEGRPVRGEIDF